MLNKLRILLLVCITAVLAACGGGGGGDDTPNFAGNYRFTNMKLTSNNCNADVATTLNDAADTVTQDGRAMSINSEGTVLYGVVDADNGGFAVSITEVSDGIPVLSSIAFRTITTGSKYELKFTTTAAACTVVYVGTATKI